MQQINIEFTENITLGHLDELHTCFVNSLHGLELDEIWIERSDGTIEEVDWPYWRIDTNE